MKKIDAANQLKIWFDKTYKEFYQEKEKENQQNSEKIQGHNKNDRIIKIIHKQNKKVIVRKHILNKEINKARYVPFLCNLQLDTLDSKMQASLNQTDRHIHSMQLISNYYQLSGVSKQSDDDFELANTSHINSDEHKNELNSTLLSNHELYLNPQKQIYGQIYENKKQQLETQTHEPLSLTNSRRLFYPNDDRYFKNIRQIKEAQKWIVIIIRNKSVIQNPGSIKSTTSMNSLRQISLSNGSNQIELSSGETIQCQYILISLFEGDIQVFNNKATLYLTQRGIYFVNKTNERSTAVIKEPLHSVRFLLEDIYTQSADSVQSERQSVVIKFQETQKIKMHQYDYHQLSPLIRLQMENSKQAKELANTIQKLLKQQTFKQFQQQGFPLNNQAVKQQQQNRLAEISKEMKIQSIDDLKQNAKQLMQQIQTMKTQISQLRNNDQVEQLQSIMQELFGNQEQSSFGLSKTINMIKPKTPAFLVKLSEKIQHFLNTKKIEVIKLSTLYQQFTRAYQQAFSPNDIKSAINLNPNNGYQLLTMQGIIYVFRCNGDVTQWLAKIILQTVARYQSGNINKGISLQAVQELMTQQQSDNTIICSSFVMSKILEYLSQINKLCYYDGFGNRLYYPNIICNDNI